MTTPAHLLIIEVLRKDVPSCSQVLNDQPYTLTVMPSVAKAFGSNAVDATDLTVLNAASLRASGVRMSKAIRVRQPDTPLILVCAKKYAGTRNGFADAKLCLPFTPRKLINRIRQLLPVAGGAWIAAGPLRLNTTYRRAICHDREANLTPMQARLLEAFLRRPNKLLTRKFLMKEVWGTDYDGDTRTLDVHMSWLRHALEPAPDHPRYFKTFRGRGYQLQMED